MTRELELGALRIYGGNNYGDLPAGVASAVRKEAIVIAFGAVRARRQLLDAHLFCLLGEERAEIDVALANGLPAGELLEHIGANLIAAAADGRAQVDLQIGGVEARIDQTRNALLHDSAGSAAPSCVQQRDRSVRVRHKNGNAICDRHDARDA